MSGRNLSITAIGGSIAAAQVNVHLPEVSARQVSLPPRPSVLAGREELLAALHDRLVGGDGAWPRILALYGMGGAGKTSLAVEYAYRHQAGVSIAWQFAAEDRATIQAGFAALATLLGASGGPLDPRDPVASVHAVLADRPRPWLLIFDNASDPASVNEFLPPAGPGRVLITSQHGLWPPGQGLEVPVLGTEVAAGFLMTRTGDPDRKMAAELAAALGGLPLALEQAGAYMQATGSTLAEYVVLFRERRAELLERGEPSGHELTVTATFALAFSRLTRDAPTAVDLLRLLACLAPAPAPLRLLSAAGIPVQADTAVVGALKRIFDPVSVLDAVAALRRYSLVTPAGDGMVLVHRLVQAVTLDQMPLDLAAAWQHAVAALVEAAIPADPQPPENWPACAALLPHAQITLANESDGMTRLANFIGFSGNYVAARDLQQKVADSRKRAFGPEDPRTLDALGDVTAWVWKVGDSAAARDMLAKLLPIRERVSGPEDPTTLRTRLNLAYLTGMTGQAAAARDQYAALLPVRERVLGPEHPETLITRAMLAMWTATAGDPAAARDMLAKLLPIRERVSGAEHPDTIQVRGNLAHLTGMTGHPAAARDQYSELLPVFEKRLGPEHPDILIVRFNIARWTGEAGNPDAARDMLAELLPVRERVSGAEHPDTLRVRDFLARWTGEVGNPDAARDMLAELLPVRERVSGAEHPDTLRVRDFLARWTGEAGDPEAARSQYAELLPVFERVLGVEHPDTVTVRESLARWTVRTKHAAG